MIIIKDDYEDYKSIKDGFVQLTSPANSGRIEVTNDEVKDEG